MNKADLIVLGLLKLKNLCGYEMYNLLKAYEFDWWIDLNISTIYKSLDRLNDKGHITGRQVSNEKTPTKIIYELTDSGKENLSEIVRYFIKKDDNLKEFWLAICFMGQSIERDEFLQLINKRMLANEKALAKSKALSKQTDELCKDIPYYANVINCMALQRHLSHKKVLNSLYEMNKRKGDSFIDKEKL